MKRTVPFGFTVCLGVISVNIANYSAHPSQNIENSFPRISLEKKNGGYAACSGKSRFEKLDSNESKPTSDSNVKGFKILSKPRAQYTDIARQNMVTGTVRVRVTFLASGQIANIYPISQLPDGLTEQAIIAVSKIKFQPETRNGKPVNVVKVIEYSFNIY